MTGVRKDMGAAATLDLDAHLMLRVKDGDAGSYALLLEKHRRPVIHFLYRMVQDGAVAEELAQEVFLRVYRSRETYEATARFTTWLFRIATRMALNWLRDSRKERGQARLDDMTPDGCGTRATDGAPTAEAALVRAAYLREIRGAIAALPAKQRAAVLMHKYEEMDYQQIAGAMGITESAVKSLLFRAYEALRSRLAHMA